ncbi:putative expansin-B2 [Vigna umbellata]|uniref:putative expansin-B2 n=1 Tax=Vigna umbellata TaxID=87088 RepID=UPI001F5E7EAF|nr:putative expansin-B2 [Vigna umbellata]
MQVLSYISFVVTFCSLLLNPSHGLNLKLFNISKFQKDDQWNVAAATWYGEPEGAGSDGGACGYADSVQKPPLSKMISAGGSSLFRGGRGCGACYQVKCRESTACSGNPVSLMITDECPGCHSASVHFDLSGTVFGSMATPGKENSLRNVGQLQILYRRVACSFGNSIAFSVDKGANPYYFATAIEYENGDGDLVEVQLKQANSDTWLPMQRSWGSRWSLNFGSRMQPPFSIKLTEDGNNKRNTIVAENVIPSGWKAGLVYRSVVNF